MFWGGNPTANEIMNRWELERFWKVSLTIISKRVPMKICKGLWQFKHHIQHVQVLYLNQPIQSENKRTGKPNSISYHLPIVKKAETVDFSRRNVVWIHDKLRNSGNVIRGLDIWRGGSRKQAETRMSDPRGPAFYWFFVYPDKVNYKTRLFRKLKCWFN